MRLFLTFFAISRAVLASPPPLRPPFLRPPFPQPPSAIPHQMCIVSPNVWGRESAVGPQALYSGPLIEIVSQNNIALNCTSYRAYAHATVAISFWNTARPSSAIETSNSSENCAVDTTRPCNGPLLRANFPMSMNGAFQSQFSKGSDSMALFAYPARGTKDVLVKSITTGRLPKGILGGDPPLLATVNENPAFITGMCAACSVGMV